jgi:AraC-like DNA-binding protein
MTPPAHVIGFHYVVDGACWTAVEAQEPLPLSAGDLVLYPRNEEHRLASDVTLPRRGIADLVQASDAVGVHKIDHGGGGAECRIVCGFLGGETQLEPLIATLPSVMKMTVRDTPGGEWISQSFRYAARQLSNADPGVATIISKMSELLFVEALRRYLASMPAERTGFLAGLRDPAIGKALALLHTQVAREWTAEDLASAVNLSRSTFAERFTAMIGQPPMKYLTNWRMQVAAHKLKEGRLSIGQIAFDIGYESEAAFTRAFKRECGVPPATWRKQLAGGGSAAV